MFVSLLKSFSKWLKIYFKYVQAQENVFKTVLNGCYILLSEQNKKTFLSLSVHTCLWICVLSITHTGFLSKPVFLKVKVCDALNRDCHSWMGSPRQRNWPCSLSGNNVFPQTYRKWQPVVAFTFSIRLSRELFAFYLLSCLSEEAPMYLD